MFMVDNDKIFSYTYSAKQQEEIKAIREKYEFNAAEDKMEQLRKLDQSCTKQGTTVSLIAGIVSTLLFGVGMCCAMVWAETMFIVGIVTGVIGIIGMVAAYPLYSHITKKRREKIAPEIMRLTDELMN